MWRNVAKCGDICDSALCHMPTHDQHVVSGVALLSSRGCWRRYLVFNVRGGDLHPMAPSSKTSHFEEGESIGSVSSNFNFRGFVGSAVQVQAVALLVDTARSLALLLVIAR